MSPLVAAAVENERQEIPEAQPGVVLVVHVPQPPVPPVLLRFPEMGRVATLVTLTCSWTSLWRGSDEARDSASMILTRAHARAKYSSSGALDGLDMVRPA